MNEKKSSFEIEKDLIEKAEKNGEISLPEKFLTETDIDSMIKEAENTRDKSLIGLLWETGARIGEIYDLQLSDVEKKSDHQVIKINGFTGERKIPIRKKSELLNKWLKNHPKKDEADTPLWIEENGEKITYNYIRKTLKENGAKAGINKLTDPKSFRRSRAAYLTKLLPEKQVKEWFGWEEESNLEGLEKGCSDCADCPFNCSAR